MNALNTEQSLGNCRSIRPSQDVMYDFISHLMAVREEERKHLANEIHDKLGQNLLALRIDVSRLHARTLETHPRINGKAGSLLGNIDIAIQNVRDLINHLRPPVLELGLLASVEWKIREFEKYSKIPCTLMIDGEDQEYIDYDGYAATISRILHEALTNIARHAKASCAEVALSNAGNTLTITISDDGVGIGPEDLCKPNAYGLMGIKEYTRLICGSVSIASLGRQNGTVLTFAVPARD